MKNPVILHLMSRDYTFSDLEYNTSDIAIEFKESVEDDELILILFFKDSSYKCFSLARFSIDFLY